MDWMVHGYLWYVGGDMRDTSLEPDENAFLNGYDIPRKILIGSSLVKHPFSLHQAGGL